MPREDRTTLSPSFDVEEFARHSEKMLSAPPVPADDESGVFKKIPTSIASVPRLLVSERDLLTMQIDHRTGFLLSFIDGIYSVEMILDVCGMPRDEALGMLCELAANGVIALE